MILLRAVLICLALVAMSPALAVQPDEILKDSALETRARALSRELRCMVCQNQSIDESDADLARDLRVLVRERLVAGDSDTQVLDYVVSRYGEFVLLKARFSLRNAFLWGAPAILLLLGGGFMVYTIRTRRRDEVPALTKDESKALETILRRDD